MVLLPSPLNRGWVQAVFETSPPGLSATGEMPPLVLAKVQQRLLESWKSFIERGHKFNSDFWKVGRVSSKGVISSPNLFIFYQKLKNFLLARFVRSKQHFLDRFSQKAPFLAVFRVLRARARTKVLVAPAPGF